MQTDDPGWLSDWRAGAIGTAEALARFDGLGAIETERMVGRWRGSGLHTGHPLDGILESLGWQGKAVSDLAEVQPLLFRARTGGTVPLDPALAPVGIALRWPGLPRSRWVRAAFSLSLPALRARRPTARLYTVEFRGRPSAALVYDRQPVVDHFRRISDRTVLGLMDMRGVPPFFFLLAREAEEH